MSFNKNFCKSLDPSQVFNYMTNFDINLLAPDEILTIIEQVSAYDLMAVFAILNNFAPYVMPVIERMCTIDAYEYMLILGANPMYELNLAPKLILRGQYWLDIFSRQPETKSYFLQLYSVFKTQIDSPSCVEFFSNCEYPSNRLIEFMARRPDYNNFFHLLSPEEKCRFCVQDKIGQYYSDSFSPQTRISAILRAGSLDKLMATKLNTSMEYFVNKCTNYGAQTCDIERLPSIAQEMILKEIPPILNELAIVPVEQVLKRYLKKPHPSQQDLQLLVVNNQRGTLFKQMMDLFGQNDNFLTMLFSNNHKISSDWILSNIGNITSHAHLSLLLDQEFETVVYRVAEQIDAKFEPTDLDLLKIANATKNHNKTGPNLRLSTIKRLAEITGVNLPRCNKKQKC